MYAQFIIAIFLISTYARPACAGSTFDQIKRDFRPSDTRILDRDGEILQRLRLDTSVRRGQWVALADISPALRTALVLSEDRRFYEHSATSLRSQPNAAFKPALDPRAAFIVSDILATRFWTAVKTGTSKDMRDNWAMGFSQRYTVGVWVGNASCAPMWDVSGTSGAAPVWAALMNHLHRSEPSRAPAPPAGLVQSRTAFGHQLEAARSEWFIQGTEQAVFATNSGAADARQESAKGLKRLKNAAPESASPPRITAPASGTLIALDPDIPPRHQRLTFSAEGRGLRWRMDGKEFARGAEARWLPWPGRHVVQITNERGEVLDEIRLEVRGAGVRVSVAAIPYGIHNKR